MTHESELLERLIKMLGKQSQCGSSCKCGCPEQNVLDASLVRFNDNASFNAAQMQQNAVSQQSAQFAALLKQQQDFANSGA